MIKPILLILAGSVGLGASLGAGIVIGKKRITKAVEDAYEAGRKDERENILKKVEEKFGEKK